MLPNMGTDFRRHIYAHVNNADPDQIQVMAFVGPEQ